METTRRQFCAGLGATIIRPGASMEEQPITINYSPRQQFIGFHERTQRFACIVAHRRAGKTVACVHDLQRAALRCDRERPRFAYIAPFYRQAKAVAWDYLRD